MSSMKNGFSSTLNRWLGKKSKDKSTPNGKLSKSSTNLANLSVSTTDINETSQLEYNRITPLPAATSNAPFEQTFRITVLLPKDQLYVTRLGARVPLSKLLELVCEHKLLEAQKYEFRNPVDPSQVYSTNLTIGAVGLSEVRLCLKTDSYDTFNADEVIKLHRTSAIRDSLSSSEFSSRNSKHTTKTTSPYSSNNSLNSMDSTGMNYTRTPVSPPPPALPNTAPPKLMAPPRKKRAAPRPPSQMPIPERSALPQSQAPTPEPPKQIKLPEKDYFVSTPNLSAYSTVPELAGVQADCNGNTKVNGVQAAAYDNGYAGEEEHLYAQVEKKNARNLSASGGGGGSVQNVYAEVQKCPEPSPRKRLLHIKKKSAPAPPQRGSALYAEDSISITSSLDTPTTPGTPITPSTPGTPQMSAAVSASTLASVEREEAPVQPTAPPKPSARDTSVNASPLQASTPVLESSPQQVAPKPVPRQTTTTLLNAAPPMPTTTAPMEPPPAPAPSPQANVSKVLLNRTPTPEPRVLYSETESSVSLDASSLPQFSELTNGGLGSEDDDTHSKQADSGIGEPVPSPLPDSLPSEGSAHESKSAFESSSDDDDLVKVYNFKLGKTLIKPLGEHKTLQEISVVPSAAASEEQTESDESLPVAVVLDARTPLATDSTSWQFASGPISPPPNFADAGKLAQHAEVSEAAPDTPITPKIKERPVLNFEVLSPENASEAPRQDASHKAARLNASSPLPPATPTSPITEIIDELSAIINEQRMDSLIKKMDAQQPQIEAAKPNTLTNFSIKSITQQQCVKTPIEHAPTQEQVATLRETKVVEVAEEERQLQRKRNSPTNSNSNLVSVQRRSITRADSFHTTVTQMPAAGATFSSNNAAESGLNARSASYLSLTKIEQQGGLNRRSSSELSIGESPSLQSLEIIKTILNSRKNSSASGSGSGSDAEQKTPPKEIGQGSTMKGADSAAVPSPVAEEVKPKSATPELPEQSTPEPELRSSAQTKEVPKVYRYTGPPSINFSTWNERPKVHVSIKNEGDYIFGGKNASNAAVTTANMELHAAPSARGHVRASTPAGSFTHEEQAAAAAAERLESPIRRMGIPEQEYHIPITVKPLKDVTVESVEFKSKANAATANKATNKSNVTTLTLNFSAPQNNNNNNGSNSQHNAREPIATKVSQQPQVAHTSTLPRSGNTRFSMPAPSAALARSTSITQLEAPRPKSTVSTEVETAPVAPFGQNTLRKTGLKEKMLAKEQKELDKAKMGVKPVNGNNSPNSPNTPSNPSALSNAKATKPPTPVKSASIFSNGNHFTTTTTITTTTIPSAPTLKTTKTLQSAKLELKLQKSTDVYVNQAAPVVALRPTKPQSAHATTPTPPPPPPPAAPTMLKSKASTPSSAVDPREQLLQAIRNFKRDELNHT